MISKAFANISLSHQNAENAIEGNIIFGFDNIWEYDVITKK
jgi:hypothetical protein